MRAIGYARSLPIDDPASLEDLALPEPEPGAAIDHHGDMRARLAALGLTPRYVASLTATDRHWEALTDLVAPRGAIALIDDPAALGAVLLEPKAPTLHWAFMFARPAFETADMIVQHHLLNRVADLVDEGRVRSTLNREGGAITAANLRAAHAHQESGRAGRQDGAGRVLEDVKGCPRS